MHDRQPALNVRSSTSVAEQAYSTPLPLAYLATVLAGVTVDKTVYEPSAGHGALLLGSDPNLVTVNELNSDRAQDLQKQGYAVTLNDASRTVPEKLHDIVIMNPPFGTVSDSSGQKQLFQFGQFKTTQIDHAIALKNLEAMKPDGRAVLILGGKLGTDQGMRSDKYNTRESRGFYYTLYQQYKVEDHFTVAGDLYRKQGAGFPIDIILVNGVGKSERSLPASDVPRIYNSFDELGEFLDDFLRRESERLGSTRIRESSGGTSTQQRNDHNRESLPGTYEQTVRLVDPEVDRRSRDDRGGDPSSAETKTEDVLDLQPQTKLADTAQFASGSEHMAEPMDKIYSVREPHNTNFTDASGDNVSSDGRIQSREDIGASGDVPNPRRSAESGGMAGGSDLLSARVEHPKQLPYQPKSQGRALGTLVPANMQTGLNQALLKLERAVGSLDEYVADRLDYGSKEEVHKYFSAEQVDAIALAVSNLEKGSGFILGDQTGIGKGRVVAAIIRYGKVTGRVPIFITKNSPLYADMIRDLGDIGMPGFSPLVTDENLTLPLPDGRELKTRSKTHREVIQAFHEQGNLGNYDAIFTSYTQLQTIKGKEPPRRAFLRTFAPKSLIILDESHEAGGSSNPENWRTSPVANRADFARELIERSQGVLYSSATYAKNPQVMDLYARTDMRLALSNMENLTELLASGGVPLQQTLASMLTEAGQYIRRERSFEGVSFEPIVVPVNHEIAENISAIMSEIMQFDQMKGKVVEHMDKDLKSQAKKSYGDNSTGGAGATSTNFTSIMHNVIDQMLFALKAEETVQKTLELLKKPNPEKPVLALSNTMGSLLARQAQDQSLQPSDRMDVDFGTLLHRYLERSRDVIIGSPYGEKKRHYLTDDELGTAATNKYNSIQSLISETNFEGIPISPIDYITFRVNQEGYRVGEVTGREHIANYDVEGNLTYQRRSSQERSKANVVQTVKSFNEGHLDVIILNRSGSTGISLHSSEKFSDQRQRHMIVVQPEKDINSFMQMLGRIHRTGQVVPPNFTLLMGDVPAEKRPGAVLAKKMASLNANTTAARKSAFSLANTPDFMNEYGDIVVMEIMKANPEIHARLDFPLETQGSLLSSENAISKVTGRIPLLPIAEQEAIYDSIEEKYTEFVARQEAIGESILEASTLNLDAKTLARMVIIPPDVKSSSPFTGPVYAEIADVKNPQKPYTTLQVINNIRLELNLPEIPSLTETSSTEIINISQEKAKQDIAKLEEEVYKYQLTIAPERAAEASNNFKHISNILSEFPLGTPVCVTTDMQDQFYGVVSKIKQDHTISTNPSAPSGWKLKLLVADSARELTIPLSQVNTGKEKSLQMVFVNQNEEKMPIYDLFDYLQSRTREKRQIITGNLLRAREKFPGRMINFTDAGGNIRQGLLTPRGFDCENALEKMPVTMPTICSELQTETLQTANKAKLKPH
ncbi:strawberry notch family protein [Aetokthonos hydrillicola Thurmond2011]|uniref:Strawberry notch family protein n=2 Tax=Aetokthonos TaxID=1550243 RepID=A0AAP5IET5_9CYAN|nr:strawberry notch C-terminal domain-containing protein [Aetokthonos hydrillicola]MBW4590966.1 strawberry notch family protein [Aetokthonos hydrillicola CCALA 1050]MDR9899064.1 strawberry notch family protein [Aetokthonos hydrillicola Thurmond2011]